MRIKRLELTGFKSCVDRTVLDFPRGVTGIVGPNGCGKSNIVDALRWVLGEQSAKHLRGGAMEDVIFAGNDRVGPLGMAEVTIVLDNEGGPATYDDEDEASELLRTLRRTPEISVTRRLYRSGESEYAINGRTCRLRDITELFLGTGVGTKAYSIVEQGRVGQIVNAKPEDLRLFIEEAAGTTLYRSRKLAAERKIERTRDNLLRVSDVVRELERQANSLRRQARGAVRFQELKALETTLDSRLSAHRLRAIDTKRAELETLLAEARALQGELQQAAAAATRERAAARERLEGLDVEIDRERQGVYEAKGQLAEAEQRERYLRERIEQLEIGLGEIDRERESLIERKGELVEERQGLEAEARRIADEVGTVVERRRAVSAQQAAIESELGEHEVRTERTKAEIVEALSSAAGCRNELAATRRQAEVAREREQRLSDEATSLATVAESLVAEVNATTSRLDDVLGSIETAEGGKSTAAAQLGEALERRSSAEREAETRRDEASALRSRLQSLQELHDSFAGYADGVKAFMSNGGRERAQAKAVLADVIEIEGGFERAVAAVLQDRLQYVVVPDADAGVAAASYLRETNTGRASFIPERPREGAAGTPVPPGASLLAEHVRIQQGYEAVVAPLVDGVVVSDSLEAASDQWKRNGYHVTFVTREGEVVDPAGVVTGGSGTPLEEGLLTRKAELRQLAEALAGAEARRREADGALHKAKGVAAQAGDAVAGLDRRVHELTVERVSVEGDLELCRQNLARTRDRVEAVGKERDAFQAEAAGSAARVTEIEAELAEYEATVERLERQRESLTADTEGVRSKMRALAGDVEELKLREVELRQVGETFRVRLENARAAAAEIDTRVESLEQRGLRDRDEIDRCRAALDTAAERPEPFRLRIEQGQQRIADAEARRDEAKVDVQANEDALSKTEEALDGAREQGARHELALKESELERESLLEGVRERLDADAPGLLAKAAALDADASAEGGGDIDPKAMRRELDDVRAKLRRLGMVNLGAVVELEEIEARLAELIGQRDDLEKSIEDLRGTITRLNRLSRKRFQETFDAVDGIFRETFPKLFRGGRAELRLTDAENLLETGVEIHVQPPGKKLGSLTLLSGGEKALTAISLVFSIFLHKPSPFCVLDEVDAPLDEANVGRFTSMIVEMSARSQFLVITHSRRTMEGCGTLYGVTMPDPGISKIVSVDLDEGARAVNA